MDNNRTLVLVWVALVIGRQICKLVTLIAHKLADFISAVSRLLLDTLMHPASQRSRDLVKVDTANEPKSINLEVPFLGR